MNFGISRFRGNYWGDSPLDLAWLRVRETQMISGSMLIFVFVYIVNTVFINSFTHHLLAVCMYIYIYIHTYVYMCIYVYIYTCIFEFYIAGGWF